MKKKIIYLVVILILLLSLFLSLKALNIATAVANGNKPTKKVAIEADVWYAYEENNTLGFQNAVIDNVVYISNSKFAVKFFPVCKECHLCGGEEKIIAETCPTRGHTFYCERCDIETTAWFKVVPWGL